MIHLGRVRLPPTAWSPAFALALVVVIVELYLLIFFSMFVDAMVGPEFVLIRVE
ncbi:MAG: hypothetical protein ACRD2Z_09110 [Thermoanaerobaculia bacterium]